MNNSERRPLRIVDILKERRPGSQKGSGEVELSPGKKSSIYVSEKVAKTLPNPIEWEN